jgi:chemotaxis-related protein WspD
LGGPQQAAAEAADTISMVIFRLRDEWLALATNVIVEVTPVRPIHRIPHRTNPIVAGMANLRGQLYLCASLQGLLGIEPSDGADVLGARARMIVIRREHDLWAITADEVLGVNRVPREQLRNVPSTLANPSVNFSQAVFPWDGKSVGFLDEQRVFSGLRSMGR